VLKIKSPRNAVCMIKIFSILFMFDAQ
jgi:hypothetical protein